MTLQGVSTAEMGRIPPALQHLVLHRCEWTLLTMEHSRIDAIRIEDPGAPFHHIGLPLGTTPVRMGIEADGRRSVAGASRDGFAVIEAGVANTAWWEGSLETACFYFTTESLSIALGSDIGQHDHGIRTTASRHAPAATRLLNALQNDAALGQPHGMLVGDSIFVALAALLAPSGHDWHGQARQGIADWRTRRALEYIHAHLTDQLDLTGIAVAAGTSPFHLSRQFRASVGISIWQYVLRERARYAFFLISNPLLSLSEVSNAAGFESYASFMAAVRSEFGCSPSRLRGTQSISAQAH